MTSPAGSFKNSLFGQLKTLSDGVQGAFEQRIGKIDVLFSFVLSSGNDEH
jgi:hypothetical protein